LTFSANLISLPKFKVSRDTSTRQLFSQAGFVVFNPENRMAYAENAPANPATKQSRINVDVDKVLSLVRSVKDARDRVQRHTSALGYFSDAPESAGEGGKVQPISNNLATGIADLERAVGSLHEALDIFG
jgi:hypothetical protein